MPIILPSAAICVRTGGALGGVRAAARSVLTASLITANWLILSGVVFIKDSLNCTPLLIALVTVSAGSALLRAESSSILPLASSIRPTGSAKIAPPKLRPAFTVVAPRLSPAIPSRPAANTSDAPSLAQPTILLGGFLKRCTARSSQISSAMSYVASSSCTLARGLTRTLLRRNLYSGSFS